MARRRLPWVRYSPSAQPDMTPVRPQRALPLPGTPLRKQAAALDTESVSDSAPLAVDGQKEPKGAMAAPPAASDANGDVLPPLKKQKRMAPDQDRIRSLSTSPPPQPPTESFMIPGLHADDAYRMVEDEFLAVAHTFTVRLHAAEYTRVRALTKERHADPSFETARPVIGRMGELNQRRRDSARRSASAATKSPLHPRPRTNLEGLMDSPRKPPPSLAAFVSASAMTRSSAGLGAAPKSVQPPSPSIPDPPHRRAYAPQVPRALFTPVRGDVLHPVEEASDTEVDLDDSDQDDLDAPLSSSHRFTTSVKPGAARNQAQQPKVPSSYPGSRAATSTPLTNPSSSGAPPGRPCLSLPPDEDTTDEGEDADTSLTSSKSPARPRRPTPSGQDVHSDESGSDPFTSRLRRCQTRVRPPRKTNASSDPPASSAQKVLDAIPAFL